MALAEDVFFLLRVAFFVTLPPLTILLGLIIYCSSSSSSSSSSMIEAAAAAPFFDVLEELFLAYLALLKQSMYSSSSILPFLLVSNASITILRSACLKRPGSRFLISCFLSSNTVITGFSDEPSDLVAAALKASAGPSPLCRRASSSLLINSKASSCGIVFLAPTELFRDFYGLAATDLSKSLSKVVKKVFSVTRSFSDPNDFMANAIKSGLIFGASYTKALLNEPFRAFGWSFPAILKICLLLIFCFTIWLMSSVIALSLYVCGFME